MYNAEQFPQKIYTTVLVFMFVLFEFQKFFTLHILSPFGFGIGRNFSSNWKFYFWGILLKNTGTLTSNLKIYYSWTIFVIYLLQNRSKTLSKKPSSRNAF